MSIFGVIDGYCDAMDAVGELTGDDLLDVSSKKLKKDNLYWWQRIYTRNYCGNDREEVIRRLNELVSNVSEILDWILDSKYLQIQNGWIPHELQIEKIKKNIIELYRLKKSMENFQCGLKEQQQHYKKLSSPIETDFRKIHDKVEVKLNMLEPELCKFNTYINELQNRKFSLSTSVAEAVVSEKSSNNGTTKTNTNNKLSVSDNSSVIVNTNSQSLLFK